MKTTGFLVCASVLGLAVLLVTTTRTWAADPKEKETTVQDKAQVGRGGGADENIKSDSDKNDPKVQRPAPPDKGGEKTRGLWAKLHVDNRTPWFVKIYTQKEYDGTIRPYGDGYIRYSPGRVTLYARADFTDGSVKTWGPRYVLMEAGEVTTWSLYP
ncbi:MAG: hypothetical protein HY815_12470 [Candidatus Riflebacteria bacterium]|nr:hypothetical protein [Candidatus Riflebacteria bacterium]